MEYNLLINGIYWGYNPLTNHLLTSWDIQEGGILSKLRSEICVPSLLEINCFCCCWKVKCPFFFKAIVAGFRGEVAFKKHRTLGVPGTFFFSWENIWNLGRLGLNFMNPGNSLAIFPEKKGAAKKSILDHLDSPQVSSRHKPPSKNRIGGEKDRFDPTKSYEATNAIVTP